MSEQDSTQVSTLRPTRNDDTEAWKAYWKAQGQPWRTEPEIDVERQKYLDERRSITPNIEQGIYPFKDIKLNRADIEWLLSTHENGLGPVDWNVKSQQDRRGLDIRGANLSQSNLEYLPLSKVCGGLNQTQWFQATKQQRNMAAVIMREANLRGAHLEGAQLRRAFLEETFLRDAHLELSDLTSAHLEGTNLYFAHLEGASLRRAFFDTGSMLYKAFLGNESLGWVSVLDTRWRDVNLSTVKWSHVKLLGEEDEARRKVRDTLLKDKATRLDEYQGAVHASRQLAAVLQAQGLSEEAAYFAYRAQNLQRIVLRRENKYVKYLFSGFLNLLAGYGFKPIRSVMWYLVVIFGFAMAYYIFGHLPLFPDTFVFSLTSFHGRGFFPGLGNETSLHNPLVILAALEAVVGLLIEISFIATFTQRFFAS